MKNFKILNANPCLSFADFAFPAMTYQVMAFLGLAGALLLFYASLVSADSTVTRQAKNDKVITSNIAATNVKPVQNELNTRVLQAEQWELARSGESILALPVLNQIINEWLMDKDKKIEIQYPGGEEGEFWVQQLTDWLVSLGIPSGSMVTVPGSGADDVIKFDVIR